MADIKWGNLEIRQWNYMCHRYKNSNYGAHSIAIMIGNLTVFYSYDHVVAFQWKGKDYFSENDYGSRTTGKHLRFLNSNGEKQIKRKVFEKLFNNALAELKWNSILEK